MDSHQEVVEFLFTDLVDTPLCHDDRGSESGKREHRCEPTLVRLSGEKV